MNIERFHNELAMRLGYERIVNDKRILISVEESDDPVVTLKVQGSKDIRFRASNRPDEMTAPTFPEMHNEIKFLIEIVNQVFQAANNSRF